MAGEQVSSSAAGGEDEQETVLSSPQDYIEFLDNGCSYAMLFGMTYDQYWHGDVRMLNHYYEAYLLKKEVEAEEANHLAWLQGLYALKASDVSTETIIKQMGAMLSGKKAKKTKSEYPDKPFDFKAAQKKEAKLKNMTYEERAELESAKWHALLFAR